MHSYTLKGIPEDLYAMAEESAKASFRTVDQELLYRLQCAFDQDEATALHQRWIQEALASGPAAPASEQDWQQALSRGLARARQSS